MIKKTALVVLAIAVVGIGLSRLGWLSLARDGSGMWVRFFSSSANYEALEEDRARQRAVPPASIERGTTANASATHDAGSTSAEPHEPPDVPAAASSDGARRSRG
jgi:hypothetical protein